ncbi:MULTISPECIES: RluA family pseudouridine synthase [unclassified Paenibacillus]|uniref:RluA family pseudouridine synthase n=1 Tax=unclassified Paenibacillus TaxID=185978 RepID=UPI002789DB2C|nr:MULTISPECIES: RluA family pseudouridine synthase [unclassified Paenibacillus]MDQ0896674.1 23S rRNA pseudouridine1911/1915/1917 synthase [Paenibacillus sp. V4I7]MDQ0917219.1 23S rRNA pseudouridine1911/1915/1917 synthase [Paenibacillus sp. V4I5]
MSYYEPLVYIVPPEEEGFILKTVLQKRLMVSRKLLSRIKLTEKGITVNGVRQYINIKVKAGDRVEIRMEEEQSEDILPQDIPLHILHEDEHLLILAKDAGIIVHPTHGHYLNTIANGVVYHWQQAGITCRFRPVHRLDQETSGVLAIAKTPYVHQQISEQMIQHQVKKEYLAFVWGFVTAKSGTINEPIDRDPELPHVRIVTPGGYSAVTHYEVVEQFAHAALVRIWLETGRTHQIRVHMRHLGHPLLGDKMYTLPEFEQSLSAVEVNERLGRQALHAYKLGFVHPGTREWTEFNAPLPADLSVLQAWLKESN